MNTDTFYIDPTLYQGRPTDTANRLPKELRTYDLLDRLGISYLRADHFPTATIQDCRSLPADRQRPPVLCAGCFFECAGQKTEA